MFYEYGMWSILQTVWELCIMIIVNLFYSNKLFFCYPVVTNYLLVLKKHAWFIVNPCYSHNLCSIDAKPGKYFGPFRGTIEIIFSSSSSSSCFKPFLITMELAMEQASTKYLIWWWWWFYSPCNLKFCYASC